MIKATIGNTGYHGVLNGRSRSGCLRLNTISEIIEKIYKVKAPKTDMVMISAVLPVSKAIIPTIIFTSKALAGVLNFA